MIKFKDPTENIYQAYLLAYGDLSNANNSDICKFQRLVGSQGRLGSISAVCFSLYYSSDDEPHVYSFLIHTVPSLLSQLNRNSKKIKTKQQGRVRGKIDWPNTCKARLSGGNNSTAFICSENRRIFDKPENQLLKFLLHKLQETLEQIPDSLKDGQSWGKSYVSPHGVPLDIGSYLDMLSHHIHVLCNHAYLKEVKLVREIELAHITAAQNSKNHLYFTVAELYATYVNLVALPKWGRWSKALKKTIPLPSSAQEIGELLMGDERHVLFEQGRK